MSEMQRLFIAFVCVVLCEAPLYADQPAEFFEAHCTGCHDAGNRRGGLDLTSLDSNLANSDVFAKWVRIHDRIESGEMPPKDQPSPPATDVAALIGWLKPALIEAERSRQSGEERTGLRRLTKAEYENTIRDLFDLPGIALANDLPADGSAHGFDKNSDALDISHVNLAKYIKAADRTLDMAIATRPQPPTVTRQRISLANPAGFVAHVLMNGDGVMLKNKQPDPDFPPAGEQNHIDQGAHERLGSFRNGASVGLFRHEDEAFHPYFIESSRSIQASTGCVRRCGAFNGTRARCCPAAAPRPPGSRSCSSPATAAAADIPATCSAITTLPR